MLVIGLVSCLLMGCQVPSSQLSQVHLGMTEAEVLKIMGQPANIVENRDAKTLNYMLREDWAGAIRSPYSVKLVNGKVDSYGRDAGGTQRGAGYIVPAPLH
jgi:hypothetical protein